MNLDFFAELPCISRGYFRSDEGKMVNSQYWEASHPQLSHLPQLPHPLAAPKVQVMPAHQINPMHVDSDPLANEEDKDKFKCLYLLVETAVAVRQREKEQGNVEA